MRKPASVARLEREHVVGENRESPCEKRGPQRRLSIPAVAEKRDSFTVDDHRRRVQGFSFRATTARTTGLVRAGTS